MYVRYLVKYYSISKLDLPSGYQLKISLLPIWRFMGFPFCLSYFSRYNPSVSKTLSHLQLSAKIYPLTLQLFRFLYSSHTFNRRIMPNIIHNNQPGPCY